MGLRFFVANRALGYSLPRRAKGGEEESRRGPLAPPWMSRVGRDERPRSSASIVVGLQSIDHAHDQARRLWDVWIGRRGTTKFPIITKWGKEEVLSQRLKGTKEIWECSSRSGSRKPSDLEYMDSRSGLKKNFYHDAQRTQRLEKGLLQFPRALRVLCGESIPLFYVEFVTYVAKSSISCFFVFLI